MTCCTIILLALWVGSFCNALAYYICRSESIRGYYQEKIFQNYLLVEFASIALFLWLYVAFGISEKFFFSVLVTAFLIPIFLTDLRDYIIPDSISIPGIIIILAVQIWRGADLVNLAIAAAIGGGFFLFQYLVSKGKWIGSGDIRLGVLMGAALGFPQIVTALGIAYIGGAVIALSLLAFGQKQMASKLPFGTFLAAATFVTMIYGQQIVAEYWRLAGF